MPFVIDRFGDTYAAGEELPRYDGSQPQGAGRVESSQVRLVGGALYDWRGDEQALPPAERIEIRGQWVASSAGGMQTKLAALKALRGKKSKLWRTSGSTSHWRRARCLAVESDLKPGSPSWAEITMLFEADPEPWSGTTGYTVVTLNASPKTATITNNGNAVVREITVSVRPKTSPITALHIENLTTGHVSKIKYGGPVATTQTLVIDCAARTVEVGGADAYANFDLEAAHTITEWLRLAPGNNSIRITRTGGATTTTMGFAFKNGYA